MDGPLGVSLPPDSEHASESPLSPPLLTPSTAARVGAKYRLKLSHAATTFLHACRVLQVLDLFWIFAQKDPKK